MESYPNCTTDRMVFPPLASDGLILVIWSCSEFHLANFLVIQTHLSHHFFLIVSFRVLRWGGSWSQIPEGQELRIGGELRSVKFQRQRTIEIKPKDPGFTFTHRVIYIEPSNPPITF